MKHHIPGLTSFQPHRDGPVSGAFFVRVAKVAYRWHLQKPFFVVQFAVLEPKAHECPNLFRKAVLHLQGSLEIELVPPGLRL